jgi:hypothetical protein
MPAQVDIPKRFTTADPEALRRELERLAQSLDVYTRGLADLFTPRYTAIPQLNPRSLVLGMVARANLIDGDTLSIQMPPPDRKNFGKRCAILRETTTGLIRLHGGPALIGVESQYQLANDIHFVEFLLDDGAWYPSRAGGGMP